MLTDAIPRKKFVGLANQRIIYEEYAADYQRQVACSSWMLKEKWVSWTILAKNEREAKAEGELRTSERSDGEKIRSNRTWKIGRRRDELGR